MIDRILKLIKMRVGTLFLTLLYSSLLLVLSGYSLASSKQVPSASEDKFCSDTNKILFDACNVEIHEDALIGKAVCINIGDDVDRANCITDLSQSQNALSTLCREQLVARNNICSVLGEERYDPTFDPADFIAPLEIGKTVRANPYFPLTPGLKRIYQADEGIITVAVTDETIEIEGVSCVVVRDIVEKDGVLVEDTYDWYAQDRHGNVWYFGEVSRNYKDGVLSDMEGSWRAGIDGAKPGILMKSKPVKGDVYRQEWLPGEAEDIAKVINVSASINTSLAACKNGCLLIRESNPLEPDVSESKYFAPGMGLVLAVDDTEPDMKEELIEIKKEALVDVK